MRGSSVANQMPGSVGCPPSFKRRSVVVAIPSDSHCGAVIAQQRSAAARTAVAAGAPAEPLGEDALLDGGS
jgi:hypothetical protein